MENRILSELLALEAAVAALRSGGPQPDLLGHFSRLEELAAQLPATADPELRHFLQRKSYEKARLLLQGRTAEAPRGSCGS